MKLYRKLMLRLFPKKWFKCAKCGGIWMKKWSDEESAEEYKENFPNDPNIEWPIALICEDCYKGFKLRLDKLTPEERDKIEMEQYIEESKEFIEDLEKLTEKFAERFPYRMLTVPKDDDNLKSFTEYSDP